MNVTELAAVCAVHFQTVGNWLRKGLAHEREGRDTTIDLADGVRWMKARYEEDISDLRTRLSDEGAKARKTAAEARMAELRVAREEGTLVDADEVRDRWVEVVSALREAMLTVPATAVQSGLVPREREDELAALVRDALSTYADEGRTDG